MAKIQRKTQQIFASQSAENEKAQFGSMKTGNPVYSNDLDELQSNPAYIQGWQDATIDGKNPFLEEFNTINYINTSQLAYLFQQGIPEWIATTTYFTNSFCQVDGVLYKSLTDNNTNNNPATDTANWEEFSSGGGMLTGVTFFSLDPLINDKIHLLDGSLLSVGGVYDEFITKYIIPLNSSNPERFTTEEEWQAQISQYGVCNKYVYTEGVGVRLPKLGNVAYTSNLNPTVPARGNGMTLGLNDGTNNFGIHYIGVQNSAGQIFISKENYGSSVGNHVTTNNYTADASVGVTQDSANSGIVTELSNATKTIEGYWYIVTGTVSKTDIEINLDNVTADLNNKADKDLSNCTSSTFVDGGWDAPLNTPVASAAIAANTVSSFDVSEFIPNDGFPYFVVAYLGLTTAKNGLVAAWGGDPSISNTVFRLRAHNQANERMLFPFYFPANSRTLNILSADANTIGVNFCMVRRLGTNQ